MSFFRSIKKKLSFVKTINYYIIDFITFISGKKNPLIPPKRMIFIGSGDYVKIGNEFQKYFIDHGNLKTTDSILDVGCGIGRMALPLTGFLSEQGKYEGFDIVPKGINWCKKNIGSKYPNFNFQLADIYNKFYNPNGKSISSEYIFPYDDESFDFVFLTSVFSHMLAEDMQRYLCEISRVLRKGGRCLITQFILNKESWKLINEKKSKYSFSYHLNNCYVEDKSIPEDIVGFEKGYLLDSYKQANLEISEPIHWGSWNGRKKYLSFQDIIIAEKK